MTGKKSTKRALLLSGLALLMCFSMLIGSTYAWFTDSVTSGSNIIKSGNLDVEMYWTDGDNDPATATWEDASKVAIFDYDLWEPGYVQARHLKIANVGTLALKYQLRILANGVVSELADVIDVYFFDGTVPVTRDMISKATPVGTLSQALNTPSASLFTQNVKGDLIAGASKTVTIALKMQESAGNEYQGLSIGTDFSVQLLATQYTSESDSFDNTYDQNADFAPQEKPSATVFALTGDKLNVNATMGMGGTASPTTLNAGYSFQPTETAEQAAASEMANWHADFYITADSTVKAGSMSLSGYYSLFCEGWNNGNWVTLPVPTDVPADTGVRLIADGMNDGETLTGITVPYDLICEYGNDGIGFACGVTALNDQIAGTTLTVELRLYETLSKEECLAQNGFSSENYETGKYVTVGTFTYTFPSREVATEDDLKDALADGQSVILTKDMEVEKLDLPANAKVDIDLNGNQLTVEGLEATSDVTITDGNVVLKKSTYPALSVKGDGNLVLNNVDILCNEPCNLMTSGSLEAAEYVALQVFGGTCELNNCNIEVNVDKVRYANSAYGIAIHDGNLIMNGGSVKVTSPGSTAFDYQAAFAAWQNGEKTITLNGVTIDAKNYFDAGSGSTTIKTTDANGSWDGKCITSGNGTYTVEYK